MLAIRRVGLLLLGLLSLRTPFACAAPVADGANETFLGRRLESCSPSDPTCTCINPDYPCYADYDGTCSCWGMSEARCGENGGQYCKVPDTCVDNCAVCKTSTECRTCEDDHWPFRGKCVGAEKFAGSGTSVHVKGNLVLLGQSEAYSALTDAYTGELSRYEAISFAARGFLNFYKDVFDGVIVFPYKKLAGSESHGQQWGASSLKETGGSIQSLISLQNYGPGYTIPLLHEVAHRWGVFQGPMPCCHWGLTAFDKHGQLGGYKRDTIQCKSGTFPNCNSNKVIWDFNAGSTQTSNDGIGAFSKYELLIMGLYSAEELASEEPLVHCADASPPYGQGKVEVTCTEIKKRTPAQIYAALSDSLKSDLLSRGDTVRMAALVVFPSAAEAAAEAKSASFEADSDLEWLNTYIGETPARFRSATYDRAFMSFTVSESDKRSEIRAAVGSGAPRQQCAVLASFLLVLHGAMFKT